MGQEIGWERGFAIIALASGTLPTAHFRAAIRLSEHEMVGIQRVAATKGIPYQTLISELIHQFVEGDPIQKS